MAQGLDRDPLFVALTRPQMFGGVTYTFFVFNFVATTKAFLIFRSVWVLGFALVAHLRHLAGPGHALPARAQFQVLAMQFLSGLNAPDRGQASFDREQTAGSRLPYAHHVGDRIIALRDRMVSDWRWRRPFVSLSGDRTTSITDDRASTTNRWGAEQPSAAANRQGQRGHLARFKGAMQNRAYEIEGRHSRGLSMLARTRATASREIPRP